MVRLTKIGNVKKKNSKDIKNSKIGIGFEKLDRVVRQNRRQSYCTRS